MQPAAAVVLAVGLVLTACRPSPEGVEGAANRLKGQRLEVAAVWADEEEANFRKVLTRFQRQTGADVRYTSTGEDMARVLERRIRAGSPPDVAVLPQPGLMGELARRKLLTSVEQPAGALVDANYAPVWRDLGSVDGTLYGVWFKAANKSTFWYRTEAFFDAGVAPPKTWSDLLDVMRRLHRDGGPPLALGAADGWTLTDWFENVYLRSAGPARYDQLARHQLPWTDQSVKDALRSMAQVLGRHEWLAGGVEGALGTDFERSVLMAFGTPPQAAMTLEGDFVASEITRTTEAKVGSEARFFEFPSINGSPRSLVLGGDVAVLLRDSPAGRELVRFLATPSAAEPWAEARGFSSPNREVDPAAYPDLPSRQLARTLTQPGILRFDLSDLMPASFGATPGQGMWRILQDWLRNPADVDGTAERLQEALTSALSASDVK